MQKPVSEIRLGNIRYFYEHGYDKDRILDMGYSKEEVREALTRPWDPATDSFSDYVSIDKTGQSTLFQ